MSKNKKSAAEEASVANQWSFNVLSDRWIPLDQSGQLEYASYVELLAGEKDAEDVIHPRDDVRFYIRMLLSALTQALFPPKDKRELRERIEKPLGRSVVEARIRAVMSDFELVATPKKPGFMQIAGGKNEERTDKLLFGLEKHVLTRSIHQRGAIRDSSICAACAVPLLYAAHAFAPAGGRGWYSSVRGSPCCTTLMIAETLRQSVWSNTLHRQSVLTLGPLRSESADETPWKQNARSIKKGDVVGLCEGLFWPARALRLARHSSGPCVSCGHDGDRLIVIGFEGKSQNSGALYPHPYSPTRDTKKGRLFVHLRADRPSWTGLLDLIGFVDGDRNAREAPVLEQWRESLGQQTTTLAVLDYSTDKASFVGSVVELFPLSRAQLDNSEFRPRLRALVGFAEQVLFALRKALKKAHSSRGTKPKAQRDGYWAADAEASFWQRTEPHFWQTYRALLDGTFSDDKPFREALCRAALALYDEHTAASMHDAGKIDLIVGARRSLRLGLGDLVEPEKAKERKQRGPKPRAPKRVSTPELA